MKIQFTCIVQQKQIIDEIDEEKILEVELDEVEEYIVIERK